MEQLSCFMFMCRAEIQKKNTPAGRFYTQVISSRAESSEVVIKNVICMQFKFKISEKTLKM
jgi:hypothetical protein